MNRLPGSFIEKKLGPFSQVSYCKERILSIIVNFVTKVKIKNLYIRDDFSL